MALIEVWPSGSMNAGSMRRTQSPMAGGGDPAGDGPGDGGVDSGSSDAGGETEGIAAKEGPAVDVGATPQPANNPDMAMKAPA